MKKLSVVALALSLFSFAAMAADQDCSPKYNAASGGQEVMTIAHGWDMKGASADKEIAAADRLGAKVQTTKDLFGRELAVITQRAMTPVMTKIDDHGNYAMARVDRYCSKSATADAECVFACVQWSTSAGEYDRP
jgi:hypothetical protein